VGELTVPDEDKVETALDELPTTATDLGSLQLRLNRLLETLARSSPMIEHNGRLEEIAAALELLANDAEKLVDGEIQAFVAKHLDPGE
jgi:hypothetical protein